MTPARQPSLPEFVALTALLMSMVAMSIDTMLPSLGVMAAELGASGPNDRQLILALFFLGLSFGQLFYGPLSDAIGRRRALILGVALFFACSLLCTFASSFPLLLAGRLLQGFGAAGPRVVSTAMVRDLHEGRAMARVMSVTMSIFILVPVLAPAIGQGVLFFAGWRVIFAGLSVMGLIGLFWFMLRQPETLAPEKRIPVTLSRLWASLKEVLGHPVSLGYIFATSAIFGAFIGYLNSTQQIFGEAYGLGPWFPLYFGTLASGFGLASFINSRLVMRFGMHYLSVRAGWGMAAAALVLVLAEFTLGGLPPLWLFMACCAMMFFAAGLLFGNYNALAMEPMGHIAGAASAIIGMCTTGLSLIFGMIVGQSYQGTPLPVALGFGAAALLALAAQGWAENRRRNGLP